MILASDPWVSIGVSYALVLGSIAILAIRSRQRGRQLAEQVPEDERRWM